MNRYHRLSTSSRLRLVTPETQKGGLRLVRKVPLIAAVGADSIVRDELESGRLALEALRTAWQYRAAANDPRELWRILADVQGTDAAALFRAAAERAGYLKADVSASRTGALLTSDTKHYPLWRLKRMAEVGVFPAVLRTDSVRPNLSCSLVCFEPKAANMQSLVSETGGAGGPTKFVSPRNLAELIATCIGEHQLQPLWWYRRYVVNKRPIRLFTSAEFRRWRRAA